MTLAIKVENLSKAYQIGQIGTGTISRDFERWFVTRVLGREDPFLKLGQVNDRSTRGETDVVWSLKDINLEIEQGDAVGIIGRNGAGKSTLLKLLSRVTSPTTGSIKIKGRVASLLEVGTGFHPELTGRENIYLNGSILGMRKREIDRKLDEIVDFSGVERYIDTPVKRYSSGMSVRLAFAVAAHLESEILIVDEVLAVGDASFQEKCLGKMESVSGEGRTVLFVSHNMSSMQQLCSECVLLTNGEIHRIGSTAEIVGEYLCESRVGSDINIREWTDRKSSGEALLTRIKIMDSNRVQASAFTLGNSVVFQLEAEIYQPLDNPSFGVIIHSPSGEKLIDLRSAHDGLRIGRVEGLIRVEAQINNLNLYPGRYYISPWIADTGSGRDIDYPRLCASFQVLPSPGKWGDLKLDSRLGKYHVIADWSCSGTMDAVLELSVLQEA